MEWVETTGRTIEEAREAALDQLGVDASDAEFVVLAEPRPGLFGRMRGEARVRARVKPTAPRPKRTRSRRPAAEQRRGGTRAPRAPRAARGAVAVDEGPDRDSEADAPEVDVGPTDAAGNGAVRRASGSSQTAGAPSAQPARRRRSRRGRGGGGQGASATAPASSTSPAGSAVRTEVHNEEGEAPMSLSFEEQGEAAREFVAGLLEEMGIDADVAVRAVDDSTAEVAVTGSGLGILVGPGGTTLGALQELTRTVVQKRTGGHSERILLDVAGYRAKRADALRRFTTQIAEEVLSSGSEKALEPMSASDRKVVHDTVNEMPGVQTRSEGEDPRRYIVISPSTTSAETSDGA